MKNFLKNSMIYQNFRVEELRTIFFGNKVIGYDKVNDEVVVDETLYTKMRETLNLIFLYCCLLITLPHLYSKEFLSGYEIALNVTILFNFVFVTLAYLYGKNIRQLFADIILNLEVIDHYLSRYYRFHRSKRTINYIISFYTFIILYPTLLIFIFCIYTIFFLPSTRPAAALVIIIFVNAPYYLYAVNVRLLLNDRLTIFDELIWKLCDNLSTSTCRLCTRKNVKSDSLCYSHAIEYIYIMKCYIQCLQKVASHT